MGTIAFYVFVEIIPVMIVVDSNFLDVVSDERDSDLTEPLFNTSRISGITEQSLQLNSIHRMNSHRDFLDNTRSGLRHSPGGMSNKSFSDVESMFHSNDQLNTSPTFDGVKDFDISLRSSKQVQIVQNGEDILTIPSSVFKQESEFEL